MSLDAIPIFGYDKGGLNTYRKPFLLEDQQWQKLYNFYPFRDRMKQRQGLELLGRLQRIFSNYTLGPSKASPWSFNLLTVSGFITGVTQANPGVITTAYAHGLSTGDTVAISQVSGMTQLNGNLYTITVLTSTTFQINQDTSGFSAYTSGGVFFSNRLWSAASVGAEPNAQLTPGSVSITLGAITFTDQGNGLLTSSTGGNSGTINYVTGAVTLTHTAGVGAATTFNLNYYPSLPVMGIPLLEQPGINTYLTLWFDTKYAYTWNGSSFQEFLPGTTWTGTNSDFFWGTNYRGVNPQDRLFFVTNFVNQTQGDPIRYTNGSTWTPFSPPVSGNQYENVSIGNIGGNGATFSGTLPNAPILPGSVSITVAGITFTDPTGSGTLTGDPNTNTGTINYSTGAITLTFNPVINFSGAITNITKANPGQVTSAAHHLTTGAQVTITGVNGMTQVNGQTYTITFVDANNFTIGVDTTGFSNYVNGGEWTLTVASQTVNATYETGSDFLFQARIIIPYFGRLLALNVWEGNTAASAVNIFNRCRFSQIGNPVQSDAWRSDVFGKGGFIDAPTNEMILGATFLNNTLVVFFEKTTWQLRYVGEYGLPFIWERIASDLGSDSTFSTVLFNNYILAIGDKAIISADSNSVNRIDLDIPDQIFLFQDINSGPQRVQGIRDYQRELVFWTYPEADDSNISASAQVFPNRVIVYNYRNQQWAIFRENVTAFGTFQTSSAVLWNSQTVFWQDQDITWDDPIEKQGFPAIVSGNQQGWVHYYGYNTPDDPSLAISAVSATNYGTSSQLVTLTIPNHNLENNDIIYLTGIQFTNSGSVVSTNLNNQIFKVQVTDANNLTLFQWNFVTQGYETDFSFTPNPSLNTYVGGGQAALYPTPDLITKDFNPYQGKGLQTKMAHADFLMSSVSQPPYAAITGATNANPCVITSNNHGLISGQMVTITGISGMTQLNIGQFYKITVLTANTFSIDVNSTNFGVYAAGGTWQLVTAGMSVLVWLNSSFSIGGNILIGNRFTQGFNQEPFYGPASDYVWQRFFARSAGQYFRLELTWDDNLQNTYWNHTQEIEIHGIVIHARPGGKIPF
jgi:hypothetical protein